MRLRILSPSGIIRDVDNVEAVFLPGTSGEFEVLRHHAPILSSLDRGAVRYRTSDGRREERVETGPGFVTVENDNIEACVEC